MKKEEPRGRNEKSRTPPHRRGDTDDEMNIEEPERAADGSDKFIPPRKMPPPTASGAPPPTAHEPVRVCVWPLSLTAIFLRDFFRQATSALDAHSEAQVQDALSRLTKGRTVLVIAHRLSTVVDADKICVLSKGKASVQLGVHEARELGWVVLGVLPST